MTEHEERERSLAHIKDPDQWVHLGKCPIKRRRGTQMPEVGYLVEGAGPRVYLGNLFNIRQDDAFKDYASFEAIIDDGWVVD